jgi:hypothetical protein
LSGPSVVYSGRGRVVAREGNLVAHLEIADGAAAWCEVRTPGTGGPLSGPLVASYRDGGWADGAPDGALSLAAFAAEAAGIELDVPGLTTAAARTS